MNDPFVSVGQQLKDEMSARFEPIKVEVPQPNTGFAAQDNPQPEAPAPVNPNAAQIKDDFEKRMSKVMSQAQKVQADRQQVAAERQQHAADLAELARYRELKARAKEDPVAWAEEGGYQPDQYAAQLIEKGSLTPERRKILEQQQELQELKSWRQSQEAQQAQAQTQQHYSTVRSQLASFGQENPEQFDLVHRTKSYDRVLSAIQQEYKQAEAMGDAPSDPWVFAQTAFERVESELEQYYAPVLESPKLRSKLAPAAAEQQSPAAPSSQLAVRKPAGTINSKMRAASAPPKELSEGERLQRAGEVLLSQIYGRR